MSRLSFHLLLLTFGIAANIASAQTFVTLHSFSGADGEFSQYAGLVQATNGELYGAMPFGGANSCISLGCGTIFKMTPSGALTTLYSFCLQTCVDGEDPQAGLMQAANGDLYGTTYFGGAHNGSGTIFKMTPGGTPTTIYSFCSQSYYGVCEDGQYPNAGLVQAANGNLYGTTYSGGQGGTGTVFKITPSGTLTTLYSFPGDAGSPVGLIQAANGDLYGTTHNSLPSSGTIFKMTPDGVPTTLYNFCSQTNCTDGSFPNSKLIQATNGDIYGTTLYGGASSVCPDGCGTVFKITLSGTLTTIYSFCSQPSCTDGLWPEAGLVQGATGNFYGTALGGSGLEGGIIFKMTPSGTVTTLYNFCLQAGCPDGGYPGELIQGTNGIFYGITNQGGASGYGTVFAFSTGQAPFVETRPTIGVVGEIVTIVGYGLTGATSVTFNGIPAAFIVEASTVILTRVPTGATSGKVQVVTPGGTLTSNKAFEVAP